MKMAILFMIKCVYPLSSRLNIILHLLPLSLIFVEMVTCDLAVKTANGTDFVGPVWPGDCLFPDFTMDKTRKWWGGLYRDYLANGIDGVWNDMNEPSVFNAPTKTMPEDNHHRGFGGGSHSQFHNIFGMMMIKASREGILAARPEKRPFVLSRANFLGGHRFLPLCLLH